MDEITVRYNSKIETCKRYSQADVVKLLRIFNAWKEYAASVRYVGKSPQISSAFSQAFSCLQLGLVERNGHGVDAFRLDADGNVQDRVEIKATSTRDGRNDIRLFAENADDSIKGNQREAKLDFDELIWLRLLEGDAGDFEIYRFLPANIKSVPNIFKNIDRGGRVNVTLMKMAEMCRLEPVQRGNFTHVLTTR